jgi:tetratricopeptide (TPR) repeat protein
MKNLSLLILPVIYLLSCQTKQEPAKTGSVPDTVITKPVEEKKEAKLTITDEKPLPSQGMRDSHPPTDDMKKASVNFRRGMELIKADKIDEGIDYLSRALETEPNNARIYFNRGFAYYTKKDYVKAQADFNSSLKINPSDTVVILYSGLVKYYQNDLKGAMVDYSNAISKSKRYSTAYFNRGLIKGQTKDYKGAIADFTQAIIFNPDYSQAYFNRGLAYWFHSDSNNACMDWIQAMRMGAPDAQKAIDAYCGRYKNMIK